MSTNPEVLKEARRQIGLLLRSIRKQRKVGTLKFSKATGLSVAQVLDIELARKNYTIDSFLKYIQAVDCYFFLSEKEGHHLDHEHMISKMDPDKAAL